jgi:hypothetical protein
MGQVRRAKLPFPEALRGAAPGGNTALTRRQWLTCVLLAGVSTGARRAAADEPRVPPRLQAELLAKVAAYDGHFAARAAGRALVLILVDPGDPDSERFGAQIRAELGKQPLIGGVEHMEEIVRYSSPEELTRVCREHKPAIIYVAPGLTSGVTAMAVALRGIDVLTVAAVSNDVLHGIVLGFEVISGKPKLLIHLTRARHQNVAFKPELLRLARVIE